MDTTRDYLTLSGVIERARSGAMITLEEQRNADAALHRLQAAVREPRDGLDYITVDRFSIDTHHSPNTVIEAEVYLTSPSGRRLTLRFEDMVGFLRFGHSIEDAAMLALYARLAKQDA